MNVLWDFEAFAQAVGGRIEGAAPGAVTGISIDSRTLKPGEAFFAIRGDRFDGHDYVEKAFQAGASVAVATEGRSATPASGAILAVPDDPLDALVRLGRAARERMRGGVIAVTGSVGKTGTKEMLASALGDIGATHAPTGSFNNHWGVPLTLARMPAETRYGIFEIGMNHAGEIRPLTRMVRPQVAIVTTVLSAHLENFDNEEGIAEAKAEIFEGLEPGGVAILNRDNQWFELLARRATERGARIVSFGEHREADLRIASCDLRADSSRVVAEIEGEEFSYELGAPGRHLVQNSLAVIAAARAVGVDPRRIAPALARFSAPKGRGARLTLSHPGGPFTIIDESYNANPASMRAALSVLARADLGGGGRRIAVLGDMLELGDQSVALHRGLRDPIEEAEVDCVFLAGPSMQSLWRDLPDRLRGAYAEKAEDLEPILAGAVGPGDVIMIKASAGTRFGPLVEALKRRFVAEFSRVSEGTEAGRC